MAKHSEHYHTIRSFQLGRCIHEPRDDRDIILPPTPTLAYLELTPACNNRCPGCSNGDFIADFTTRKLRPGLRHPLSGVEWEQILDRLGPSVRAIYLTGGEATMHPDFEAITASIERRGLSLALFTNGRWRDSERLVAHLKSLSGLQGCLISLHGATAATHELFSGVAGSFDETVANIKLAVQAGLPVTISTVITAQGIAELEQVWELSRSLGAREVTFNRYLIPVHREDQPANGHPLIDMAPTRRELRAAVRIIESLRSDAAVGPQVGYGPCIPQCFTPSSSQGCGAGDFFFSVDPWGNVKPCTDSPIACGNLLTQTLEELWSGETMARWRGLIPTGCSSCAALSSCRTGCRAMALASGLGHDPLMEEPLSTIELTPERARAQVIPLVFQPREK